MSRSVSGATVVSSMVPGGQKRPGIGGGMLLSTLLHGSAIAVALLFLSRPQPTRPPVYRVDLVGAPTGPRQAGVVTPAAASTASSAAPAASGAERAALPEKAMPTAKKTMAPPKATPSATPSRAAGTKDAKAASKQAPAVAKAGSGKVGGKGADVANVKTEGIAFPFPGYLNNIVRQLTLSWSPRRVAATLVTEVKFVIRRDGSVSGIDIVKSSGDRLYDSEAAGAVEAVGATRGFGVLPKDWKDDALVVYFTFDYSLRP